MKFELIQDILDITFGCWVNAPDFSDWFASREEVESFCEGATVSYITANHKGELVIELEDRK